MDIDDKARALLEFIGRRRSALVAFSGGVDSCCLAFAARRALGRRARCVTAVSPALSVHQRRLAAEFAKTHQLNHVFVSTREMDDPNYVDNPVNRCYFCKSELYGKLLRLARQWGVEAIFDGSNLDDLGDYRPGRKAAAEHGVLSPLIEAGLDKQGVRRLSRKWGLSSWDRPAMPCLSSRFPYGVPITARKLRQVERSEAFLRRLGFRNFRVRHHEELARLEVDLAEMPRLSDPALLSRIEAKLRGYGYQQVTVDPQGFRSGSLNAVVELES